MAVPTKKTARKGAAKKTARKEANIDRVPPDCIDAYVDGKIVRMCKNKDGYYVLVPPGS